MFSGITSVELADCLGEIAPVQLKGVELLQQFRPHAGAWFPQLPPDVIAEATSQIIAYTKDCAAVVRKLQMLPAMTLATRHCAEFCL
jgi:hypothetical protein